MSLEAYRSLTVKELENKILELRPERTAVFVADPILASGAAVMAPPGYHKACLCSAILLAIDRNWQGRPW